MFALFLIIILIFGYAVGDERGGRVRRIVGGEVAPQPPVDDPVVYTRFAEKTARVLGVRDSPHYVFRGLRFGLPPIGKNRFLRPRQYFLQGFENATIYPPPCVQPVPGQDYTIGSEDCLFLNVFTPTLPTGMEGLPVIVWIHGGGFRYGSASQYGVRHLVGKQVIVVTIQYRLGSLGFLTSGSKELPGNAALWDMVLAVQWVRNYIGFFGGNPHKIVVMGHGTGASSAMMVTLSNVAKGLASGLVAMSGSAVSRWSVDESGPNTARQVADANGCPTTSVLTMVRCLQQASPDAIIRDDSRIEFQRLQDRGFVSGLSGRLGTSPIPEGVNDGRALPGILERDPLDELSFQDTPKIPLLTGVTRDETKRACEVEYKNDILTKLQTVPNFLDNVLIKNLQSSIGLNKLQIMENERGVGLLGNLSNLPAVNALNPQQFRNYVQVPRNNLQEGLSKISEVTGDALFNVPAFLTAELWSRKGSPTFLYRFEHNGKRKKGFSFLKGFPLVGNSSKDDGNDIIGHGDELSYIFDPQDMHGRALDSNEPINEEDAKVRDIFTQMIVNFARFGKINLGSEKVKPFSMLENNFIQISSKPKIANNFRFCEMALWVGLAKRLQSSSCQFLNVLDSQLKNLQGFFDVNKLQNGGAIGNILGGGGGGENGGQGGLNLGILGGRGNSSGQEGLNLGGIRGNNSGQGGLNLGVLGGRGGGNQGGGNLGGNTGVGTSGSGGRNPQGGGGLIGGVGGLLGGGGGSQNRSKHRQPPSLGIIG